MNLQLVNVLLLGLAFHLIFFAFQTSVFIQQTVVNSIKNDPNYNFHGDGYISLCVTYTVFALSNWLAPSIIALLGIKYGMFLGAVTYVIYSASFIYPTTILFYTSATLIGLGAGPLWTAQGSYLAKNSDADTSSRNAAIFWSMLQSSILFGNIFVYLCFNSESKVMISDETRYIVYGVLTGVCALGTLVILTFSDNHRTFIVSESNLTAWGQFLGALKLSKTLNMLLLSFAFLFTGQLLSFYTGIYGTAIGATLQFGLDAKKYIGLSGVCIGVGEILGGSIFGLMGSKGGKNRLNRDTIFVFGYVITIAALTLIYVNLPPDSSLVEFAQIKPILDNPKINLALLSSVLIGFGDACFNTQIYSLLMNVYSDNSVAAFALFKFVQSIGSAVAFLYSTALNLYYQLYLLVLIGTVATLCFCYVEWTSRNGKSALKIEKSDSQQEIVNNFDGHKATITTKKKLDLNQSIITSMAKSNHYGSTGDVGISINN